MLEALKRLNGGTIHLPARTKDRPDRDRLALRYERFKSAAYAAYYNEARTHRSLNKDAPLRRSLERLGAITSQPVLGGLHHRYCRI